MGKIIQNIEVKVTYDDDSILNMVLDDFLLIGVEHKEDDKIRVHSMDRIRKLYNASIFITHIERVKENIEEIINKKTSWNMEAFNATKDIFKYFNENGIEGVRKAYKDGKFGKLPKDAIDHALNLLKDLEPDKEIEV